MTGPTPSRRALFAPIALVACVHCGGATTTTTTQSNTQANNAGDERATAPVAANRCAGTGASGGIAIEGQLGTLRQSEVSATLNPALERLQACYTQRLEQHPYLAGGVQFKIRIGTDGAVRWVLPIQSNIGDRQTERCMADALRALRFPEPCGGETETTWGPSFEGGEDNRPAVPWDAARVQAQVNRHRAQLSQCLRGASGANAEVTLYVGSGGRVATAGASVSTQEASDAIDCLVSAVSSWTGLPDPGSYPAKTSFRVP